MLPKELEEQVYAELDEGEAIRWIEQPEPAARAASSLVPALFAIPFTAVAIYMATTVLNFGGGSMGPPPIFLLVIGLFVLVGIAMLLSPLWAYQKATGTIYVVTNRRAIIIDGGLSRSVESFLPHQLDELRRVDRADGYGDLVFDRRLVRSDEHGHHYRDVGFLGVSDARAAERMIRELVQEAAGVLR